LAPVVLRSFQGLVLAAAVAAGAASAATPASVIEKLNAQRTQNGLPALVENERWSAACAAHVDYLRRTHDLTHIETKGRPGYTKDGAWAAVNSVLALGKTWARGNPWENGPTHVMQVLAPQLRSTGVYDGNGYSCAITWPGYRVGTKNVLYSYPGDGTSGWRTAETAREGPYTAGEAVGLPQGTRTGLILLVFADGPWARSRKMHITSAELIGPRGPVEVRTADNRSPRVGPYMTAGGVVIPVKPLQRGALYRASVKMTSSGVTLTRSWSFTTAR
jgi:hypothetical protein